MKKYYKVTGYRSDEDVKKAGNHTLSEIKESISNFDIGYVFWTYDDGNPKYTIFPYDNKYRINLDGTHVKEITQKEYFELQKYPQDDPTFKEDLEKFIKSEYKIGDVVKTAYFHEERTIKSFAGFINYSYMFISEESEGKKFLYEEGEFAEKVKSEEKEVIKSKYLKGNKITFKFADGAKWEFEVQETFLEEKNGHSKQRVNKFFNKLGIKDKYSYAESIYGYITCHTCIFPTYNEEDYTTATKIIEDLQKRVEEWNKTYYEIDKKTQEEESKFKVRDKLMIGSEKVQIIEGSYGYYITPIVGIVDILGIKDLHKYYKNILGYLPDTKTYSPEVKTLSDLEKVIDALRKDWDKQILEEVKKETEKAMFTIDDADKVITPSSNPFVEKYSEELLHDYLKKGYKVKLHPSSKYYDEQVIDLGTATLSNYYGKDTILKYQLKSVSRNYKNTYNLKDLDYIEMDKYLVNEASKFGEFKLHWLGSPTIEKEKESIKTSTLNYKKTKKELKL